MGKKDRIRALAELDSGNPEYIDCACLIHGTAYDWQYVDNLYNMLCRNLTPQPRLHVYTEAQRPVPAPYVKHELLDWGIAGPKRSWWYKMQMFNHKYHSGPLLYFDLDIVITGNIDWIWQLPLKKFYAIRDFKSLWKPHTTEINSSVMWWNTADFDFVWQHFKNLDLTQTMRRYPGDQDYLSSVIDRARLRYFDSAHIKSWRWQCLDGGYDFKNRTWNSPGTGTAIDAMTKILVFHGQPKPGQVEDPIIKQHWK